MQWGNQIQYIYIYIYNFKKRLKLAGFQGIGLLKIYVINIKICKIIFTNLKNNGCCRTLRKYYHLSLKKKVINDKLVFLQFSYLPAPKVLIYLYRNLFPCSF